MQLSAEFLRTTNLYPQPFHRTNHLECGNPLGPSNLSRLLTRWGQLQTPELSRFPWKRTGFFRKLHSSLPFWPYERGVTENHCLIWQALIHLFQSLRQSAEVMFDVRLAETSCVYPEKVPRAVWIGSLRFADHPRLRCPWRIYSRNVFKFLRIRPLHRLRPLCSSEGLDGRHVCGIGIIHIPRNGLHARDCQRWQAIK